MDRSENLHEGKGISHTRSVSHTIRQQEHESFQLVVIILLRKINLNVYHVGSPRLIICSLYFSAYQTTFSIIKGRPIVRQSRLARNFNMLFCKTLNVEEPLVF